MADFPVKDLYSEVDLREILNNAMTIPDHANRVLIYNKNNPLDNGTPLTDASSYTYTPASHGWIYAIFEPDSSYGNNSYITIGGHEYQLARSGSYRGIHSTSSMMFDVRKDVPILFSVPVNNLSGYTIYFIPCTAL